MKTIVFRKWFIIFSFSSAMLNLIGQDSSTYSFKSLGTNQVIMARNTRDDMTGDIIKCTENYMLYRYNFCDCTVNAQRDNETYSIDFSYPFWVSAPSSLVLTSKDYIIIKFSDGTTTKLFHKTDNSIQDGLTIVVNCAMGVGLSYLLTQSTYNLLTSKPVVKIRYYYKVKDSNNEDHSTYSDRDIPSENQKTIMMLLKALKGPTTNDGTVDHLYKGRR